jgi:alpha-galactosidase
MSATARLVIAMMLVKSCAVAHAAAQGIVVSTANTTLSLWVADDGRLYQLSYGSTADQKLQPPQRLHRLDEFYPASGNGFIQEPALQAFHSDGNTSTDLTYVTHRTTTLDPNVSLTSIELKDRHYPFTVTIRLKAYRSQDMIEQWAEIRHDEPGPVTLYRFASSSPVLRGRQYHLLQFQGDYKREATLLEEQLTSGIKILDSKIGVRATRFRIPSVMISLDSPAGEESGQVYGASLAWSGSFQFAFEVDQNNRLRAIGGINPFGSHYKLAAEQIFKTPAMLWTFSNSGKGRVSRNFHRWARTYGIRDGEKPRPVLLNNWEATRTNFDEKRIVGLFDGAKEVGVELFLLDDGWFGVKHPRNNDRAGLGDWQADPKKLPRGLSALADEAKQRGLEFGIWLEPEMVNPQSELFEKHPEWAIMQPHREPELSRYQLCLDLSRPQVRDFAWKVIDDTLGPNPEITYVKWDANRYVTQPGSSYLPPDEQSRLLIDYSFGLCDIMAKMARNYPNVMAMVCAGGGGRVDYGSLKYFHSFWPSDNTDPRGRVLIQWGFGHFFPANTISAHVTRMGRRPLKFAIDVALSGAYGIDMDLGRCTPEERRVLAAATMLYKTRLRDIVLQGDLYRLESPYDRPRAGLSYVSSDRSRAAIFVYQIGDGGADAVKPRGLDPARRYTVREVSLLEGTSSQLLQHGQTLDGATLMRDGLIPGCRREFDSSVIELVSAP